MRSDSADRHRPTRAEAIAEATAVAMRAWAEMSETYAERGAMAVARAAYEPGGPDLETIARTYESWVQEERQKRNAARRKGRQH
jgi:hypothetical protein